MTVAAVAARGTAAPAPGRARRPRRTPFVRQMSAVDCGAACLAMVLSHHGRRTSLGECRGLLSPGRDGLSARALAAAARSSGLEARGYSIEPAQFAELPLPAIAHWGFNHFVVVTHAGRDRFVILDPARGERRLTPAEFGAEFTGVVLTLRPGDQFERRTARPRPIWLTYAAGVLETPGLRGLLGQIVASSLLLQALGLSLPLFSKFLVDRVLPAGDRNLLLLLGAAALTMVVAQGVMNYLRALLLIGLQGRLDSTLMVRFFAHVLDLPFRFFQQRPTGDLLLRLSSNTVIRELVTNQSMSALLDGALVVAYLAGLAWIDARFALIGLVAAGLQVGLLVATTRRNARLLETELAASAASQSYLVEALAGVATLKVAGAEDHALQRWSGLFHRHLNVSLARGHLSAGVETVMTAVAHLAPIVFLWFGAGEVLAGRMSVGTLLALNLMGAAFLAPVESLVGTVRQFFMVEAHLERIADVTNARPEQDRDAVSPAPALTGRVELRDVGFRYDRNADWTLRHITLSIRPGDKIAIVGRSGSGKSTLARLLLGLYEAEEGQVLFDGVDMTTLDYRSLRRQVGVVLQEPHLFAGSIRQNIAFNAPGAPLEAVERAASLAGIHDDIAAMPMRYETHLDEGGGGLSGGQKQRLALARALLARPTLLILDEATSHLDATTEAQVDGNLSALDCARIVIAHRLSTVQNADRILVLDRGRIVESGTHDELLARNGAYAALAGAPSAE